MVKFRYACIIAKKIFFLLLRPHWCIGATTSRRYNHEAAPGSTQPTGQTPFFDANLTGGKEVVNYTVVAADTLATIATGLAAAVNADTNLQAIGVTGSASSTVVSVEMLSPNLTTVAKSLSTGSTETIALGLNYGLQRSAYNEVNELTSISQGGPGLFQGVTSKPVKSASLSSPVVNIQAALAPLPTTLAVSVTGSPSETISPSTINGYNIYGPLYSMALGGTPKTGDIVFVTIYDVRLPNQGSETVSYTVRAGDSLSNIGSGLATAISNDSTLNSLGISGLNPGSSSLIFQAAVPTNSTTTESTAATGYATTQATETLTESLAADENFVLTVGGTATAGDIVRATVNSPSLSGGSVAVSYTVASGDTITSIATGLKNAINAATSLQAIGVNATSSAAVVSVFQYPYYTSSVTGSGTETVTFSNTNRGSANATIGGTSTTGDVVSIVGHNAALSGGAQTASYTVAAGDTLLSISQGLAAAINANTGLKALGVTGGTAASLAWSQSFSGKTPLANGANLSAVSATDGSNNTKTNDYQVGINGGSASTLTFDANGNMTSDGTNTYKWDAENRLIQINYPGTGNYSELVYDGFSSVVELIEFQAGSSTSTRQFVLSRDNTLQLQLCESRTSSGSVSSQYFPLGVNALSAKYFYTTDHLGLSMATFSPFTNVKTLQGGVISPLAHAGSVREVTNSSGSISEQIAYDSFGRANIIQGSGLSDFGYASLYFHQPSNLCLTNWRPYSASLGRFLSRDPIAEAGGNNLFAYVENQPINFSDPSGLQYSGGVGRSNDPSNVNGRGTDTGADPHVYQPPPCPCVPPNNLLTREGGGGPDGVNNWKAPDGTIYDPKGRPICGTGPPPPTPPRPPQGSGGTAA